MTMAARRHRDLQRYFDGELSPRRAAKVREQVAGSSEDQRRLEGMQSMRQALQDATEDAVGQADLDRLWARVQVGIAAQRPLSFGERVRLWFRAYGMMAASATAAAVLALFLWLPAETATARNDCDIESLDADPGAMSTIFTIDNPEDGNKTTVIWVNELGQPIPDDDGKDGQETPAPPAPEPAPAEGQGEGH
jgi:hypothetical protein